MTTNQIKAVNDIWDFIERNISPLNEQSERDVVLTPEQEDFLEEQRREEDREKKEGK